MNIKYIAESERLKIRAFTLGDAEFIIALLNSPGWIKFIGDRNVKTIEEAGNYLRDKIIESYNQFGYGFYLVERKSDSQALGMCGLAKRDYLDHADLGFAFLPQFHGKGYAFESCTALFQSIIKSHKIEKLHAITVPENENSIQLLQKLGFSFLEKMTHPVEEDELFLFELIT